MQESAYAKGIRTPVLSAEYNEAIFGKIKWAWFAALAFGLAVVAAAGAIVNYAANTNKATGGNFKDTLGSENQQIKYDGNF